MFADDAFWAARIISHFSDEAIRAIVDTAANYVEGCVRVYEFVGYRLDQARGIIKEIKA